MSDKLAHRRADGHFVAIDAAGKPIANTVVEIEQIKHDFLFGCGAFDLLAYTNPSGNAEWDAIAATRKERWLEIFNYGTLPFYWARFEPERGKPNTEALKRAALFMKENGVQVKGHPLCWHTLAAPWLLDMTDDEIYAELMARIERDVTAFRGIVDMWDVINEVVIMPVFDKYDNGITRLCNKLSRFGIIREVFKKARECNPDATLLLNDFNTSQAYEVLVEGCLDGGVPIDVIGIQSHQHQGYWGAEKLYTVLERFSRFGKPMHFTENTFVSGDIMPPEIVDLNDFVVDEWPSTPEGEARQVENIREMYTILFEHPLIEGITQWDFSDGCWLKAPSGVVRADGTPKPAYYALKELIAGWTTKLTAKTDENGVVSFNGFKGNYRVKTANGEGCFELHADSDLGQITIK